MQQSGLSRSETRAAFKERVGFFIEHAVDENVQRGLPDPLQSTFYTAWKQNERRLGLDPTLEKPRGAALRLDDLLEMAEERLDVTELDDSHFLNKIQRIRDGIDNADVDPYRQALHHIEQIRQQLPQASRDLNVSPSQLGDLSYLLGDVDRSSMTLPEIHHAKRRATDWYGGADASAQPDGWDKAIENQLTTMADHNSFWGMTVAGIPPIPYPSTEAEAEADLSYAALQSAISQMVADPDRETHWIASAANYAPELIKILNQLFPEHVQQHSFLQEIISLNDKLVLAVPQGGPFIFWCLAISLLADHLTIPDTAVGLALLDGSDWQWKSDEVFALFKPLGLRTIPFPTRIFTDFIYKSIIHTTTLSRQTMTADATVLTWDPQTLPPRTIQSSDGTLYDAGRIDYPSLPILRRFENRVHIYWVNAFGSVGESVKKIVPHLGPLDQLKNMVDDESLKSRRADEQGIFTPFTGTFNKLLFQQVTLASTSPYCIRGGIFGLQARPGRLMAGKRPHAILWVMGLLWIRSIVHNLPPPEWSNDTCWPLVQAAIDEISALSDHELELLVAWEMEIVKQQDAAEWLASRRSYELDKSMDDFHWHPIYFDSSESAKYNPSIAVHHI